MDTVLVARTRSADFHALGIGGQPAVLAWEQIIQFLRRTLTPAHAQLFAEPNFDPERGTIEWYAEGGTPPLRLAESHATLRTGVEETLRRLVADIEAQIEQLRRAPREADRFMGELLALALEIPDPATSLYALAGQPILVAWGHLRTGPGATRGELMRFVRPPEMPMAIFRHAPGPPPRRGLWWLWLALALLLLLLLLALLGWWFRPALLAWLGPAAPVCRLSDNDIVLITKLDEERARESALRQELAGIAAAVGAKRVNCQPPAPPPEPPPQRAEAPPPPPPAVPQSKPTPNPPQADDQARVKERGGQEGKLQVTLAWDDRNDLDVYVLCPSGEEINWRAANRERCGGKLDIDANNGRTPLIGNPVENVFWDDPPPGHYKVAVQNYKQNGAPASPYRLTIRQKGKPDRVIQGVARAGDPPRMVTEFDVP